LVFNLSNQLLHIKEGNWVLTIRKIIPVFLSSLAPFVLHCRSVINWLVYEVLQMRALSWSWALSL
jgi:hypothetical protein